MEQEGGELVETVVWLAAVGDLVWYGGRRESERKAGGSNGLWWRLAVAF